MSAQRIARIAELKAELAALQVEEVEEALSTTSGSLREACDSLLLRGLAVEAMRHYRKVTGATLLESKRVVDEFKAAMRASVQVVATGGGVVDSCAARSSHAKWQALGQS